MLTFAMPPKMLGVSGLAPSRGPGVPSLSSEGVHVHAYHLFLF